jgi:uncharacterized surface protein with fasciclin (FAS1) repeats
MPTIVDVAVQSGKFKTLIAALSAAGLVDTLNSPGPFTVFAPTDEAFEKLPKGTVESLLKDIPKLKNILLYHVVPGKISASNALNLTSAKTAEGQEVMIYTHVRGELGENDPAFAWDPVKWHVNLRINDAYVVKADMMADNGVIHAINKVIIPPTS